MTKQEWIDRTKALLNVAKDSLNPQAVGHVRTFIGIAAEDWPRVAGGDGAERRQDEATAAAR